MAIYLPACFPGPPQAAGAPPSGDGAVQPSPVGGGSCPRSPPRTQERESFSGSRTSTAAGLPCHQLQQRQCSMNIKIPYCSFSFSFDLAHISIFYLLFLLSTCFNCDASWIVKQQTDTVRGGLLRKLWSI